jgi:hypothetical protein
MFFLILLVKNWPLSLSLSRLLLFLSVSLPLSLTVSTSQDRKKQIDKQEEGEAAHQRYLVWQENKFTADSLAHHPKVVMKE